MGYIYTNTFGQMNVPIILWDSRNDIVGAYVPPFGNVRVLNPNIVIVFCEPDTYFGILCEYAVVGFYLSVHNKPLVVHLVLNCQ